MGMRHHAFFYAIRFIRPYGTIVWFFPVSQEFLLGYGQTVPTGLSFGFFPCPRNSSWAMVKPSLRD